MYVGEPYGAIGTTSGEIVFATGMTGYQETLTDPSYDRQIVVQTFPHIGDTGINGEDPESSRIWVAGYVVRDPSPNVSNWRATGSLDDDLESNHIVGISHIDTRKLVRHLRSAGVMRAAIFSGDALLDGDGKLRTIDSMLDEVKATPQMRHEPLRRGQHQGSLYHRTLRRIRRQGTAVHRGGRRSGASSP